LRNTRYAVYRRSDLGKSEVKLCLVNQGLKRDDCSMSRCLGADRIIKVLLAYGPLFYQRLYTFKIGLRSFPACLLLRELSLRLFQCGLEGTRVDLEEHLPFLDHITFGIIPLCQVTLYLRSDGGIHKTICRGRPFRIYRYILLDDLRHFNGG